MYTGFTKAEKVLSFVLHVQASILKVFAIYQKVTIFGQRFDSTVLQLPEMFQKYYECGFGDTKRTQ